MPSLWFLAHVASLSRLARIACVALLLGFVSAHLSAQATWVGTTSSNWSVATNWSSGQVPTATTDVTIPAVALPAVAPVVSAAAVCRNLTLAPSSQLTIQALVTLQASGNVDLDGNVLGSGLLKLTGSASAAMSGDRPWPSTEVDKSGAVAVSAAANLTFGGSFVLRNGNWSAGGTVTFALPASFLGGSVGSTGSLVFQSSVAFTGCSVSSAPPMRVLGNWNSDASFLPGSGLVTFDGNTTLAGSPSFFNVEVGIGAAQNNILNINVPTIVRGTFTARGNTTISGNQPLTVNGALDLDNGSTFNIGTQQHQVGGAATIDGTISGPGSIRFFGATNATVQASRSLPTVVIAKAGVATLTTSGAPTTTVVGSLQLLSGVLIVGDTLRVQGASAFQGGSLTGTGSLDLDGDASFVGSSVVLPPTIRCSGNWVADSAYDPSRGSVTLDGTPGSSQSIQLSATAFGTQANFFALTIAAGASVTTQSELRIRNSMAISGQFVANAVLDIDGDLTVNVGAVFNARGFEHRFAGSVSLQTTIQVDGTGRFLFDGSSGANLSAPGNGAEIRVPNVRVAKVGGAQLVIANSIRVDGALDLLSGRLAISGTSTVTGNATFSGGHLGSTAFGGVVVVNGNVVHSGAVSVDPPAFQVSGNWTSDSLFNPRASSVTFIGTAPRTIVSSGGALRFASLTIAFGASASTQDSIECDALTIDGTLQMSSTLLARGTVSVGVQGTWNAGAGTHSLEQGLSALGSLQSTGLLVFQGSQDSSVASRDPIPAMRVAKTGTGFVRLGSTSTTQPLFRVTGDCTLDSGQLTSNPATLSVGGALRLQGGVVGPLTAIVQGQTICSGAQVAEGDSFSSASVTLTCRGNFTGHPAFRPEFGTVTMEGGALVMQGELQLASLVVPANSSVRVLSPLSLRGTLTVSGILNLRDPNQPMDVAGNCDVGTGAQMQLGSHTYRFGGSLNAAQGAFPRTSATHMEFYGAGDAVFSHSAQSPLPPITIRKVNNSRLTCSTPIDVDGNLLLEGGELAIINAAMRVRGSATMRLGRLTGAGSSPVLTVDGNVAFVGALAVTPPGIIVRGNWSADALFRPVSGNVTFAGSGGAQAISGIESRFFGLTFSVGSDVTSAAPMVVDGDVAINSAIVRSNSTSDFVVRGNLTTSGTFNVAGALRVSGNLTASGSLATVGELEVGLDASIPSGTLSIGGGRFSGSLLADGGFSSSAPVRLDGGRSGTLRSAAPLPTITIDKSAASNLTLATGLVISGSLILTQGNVVVAGACGVSGGALFQGGFLDGNGTLDVGGAVTFQGTLAFTPPNITCRGDFTAGTGFQPFLNTVTLNSNVPQQIFGANPRFHGLSVATFSSVTIASNVRCTGPVLINGLLTTLGDLDCDGSFASNTGWNAGSGSHCFAGDVSIQGSLVCSGSFLLDGASSSSNYACGLPVPSLGISRSSQVTLQTAVVSGDLRIERGLVLMGTSVVVGGDLHMALGEIRRSGSSAVLQIAGDLVCNGGVVVSPPEIRVVGDVTVSSGFAPQAGLVAFVGTAAQQVSSLAGSVQFFQVEVANNAVLQVAVPMTCASSLLVNGSLSVSGALNIDGDLTTNTNSTLNLGAFTHRFARNVSVGGVLQATGLFVLDAPSPSATSISFASAVPVPSLRSESRIPVQLQPGLVIAGGLELERGSMGYAGTVTVQGSAVFRGGNIDTGGAASTLDIIGDVSFLGATATNASVIRCGGNWSARSNFAPPAGRVEMTGNGNITSLTPGAPASFFQLDVVGGARSVVGSLSVRGLSMLVQTNASLVVGAGASIAIERANIRVFGELQVTGSGALLLGDAASLTVEEIGRMRLVGAGPSDLARIDGLDGGGYTLMVRGFVGARDFEVLRPDESGLQIVTTATVDQTAALGFRNGRFDFPKNVPGGVLLNIVPPSSPPVALFMENMSFQNTANAANVFNVRCEAGLPVTFVNAVGSFAGAAFEDDVGNFIVWTSGQLTGLGSFGATAGAGQATLGWFTTNEVGVASWSLDRQILTPSPGPFEFPQVVQANGAASSYSRTVTGLAPGFTYRFRLREQASSGGPLVTIATADVTPFSGGVPPQIFDVGSAFATIQAAVNAAIASGQASPVVRIAPGNYAAFSINGAPSLALRIVANGAGPVTISSLAGPVVVQNVPAGRAVEIGGLTIGSSASPQSGLVVSNCAGTVILDEMTIESGVSDALVVQNATAFVLQGRGSSVRSIGGSGLVVQAASSATVSGTSFSSLRVRGNSALRYAGVAETPVVEAGSTAISYPGVMPDLDVTRYAVLSDVLGATFEGPASSLWLLVLSSAYGPPVNVFEMPILYDIASSSILATGVTDAFGVGTYSTRLPANGGFIGQTVIFQGLSLNIVTGVARMSNVRATTIVAGN